MNKSGKLRLFLNFGAEKILGSDNIAFMHGPEHTALRKQLLPLFTTKALSTYLTIQERFVRKRLNKLLSQPEPQPVRADMRDLIIETSSAVFIGDYLTKEEKAEMAQLYLKLNAGLYVLYSKYVYIALINSDFFLME